MPQDTGRVVEDVGKIYGEGKSSSSPPSGENRDRQRSNLAGSPEVVVQVTLAELEERIWVVGWLSCKAEMAGTSRNALRQQRSIPQHPSCTYLKFILDSHEAFEHGEWEVVPGKEEEGTESGG